MESMSTGLAAIAGRTLRLARRRGRLPAQLLGIGGAVAGVVVATLWALSMTAAVVAAAGAAALLATLACALWSLPARGAPGSSHAAEADHDSTHVRIVHELHDTVAQSLFAANLMAGALARAAEGAQRAQAQALERLNRGALAEWQMLMLELRPGALQAMRLHELLHQAMDTLAGRGDIEVTEDIALADDGLAPARRLLVYRIAQHALSDIGRHSGASRAELEWSVPRPGQARLRIADNGPALDPGRPRPGHVVLEQLRGRAAELGIVIRQRSTPDTGAELVLELATEKAVA